MNPGQFVDRLRVEAAQHNDRQLLHGIEKITDACGFGSIDSMRRTFGRKDRGHSTIPIPLEGERSWRVSPKPKGSKTVRTQIWLHAMVLFRLFNVSGEKLTPYTRER
jgi:hypothetical protein